MSKLGEVFFPRDKITVVHDSIEYLANLSVHVKDLAPRANIQSVMISPFKFGGDKLDMNFIKNKTLVFWEELT